MIRSLHAKLFCFLFVGLTAATATSCNAQGRLVGSCEGCEAVFEYRQEEVTLAHTDTLPGFMMEEEGPKIRITGTVYRPGGEEPAGDVILYIHHTNAAGVYPTRGDERGWARRHGYLRGWVKTDMEGRYTFYTSLPNSYPGRTAPKHIHMTVLEPDGRYYWIGDIHFAGDPLLSEEDRSPENLRGGGTGLVNLQMRDGILSGVRDIELGKNVAGYEHE